MLGAPPVRPRMFAGTSSTRNPALHAWTSASTESMYSTGYVRAKYSSIERENARNPELVSVKR